MAWRVWDFGAGDPPRGSKNLENPRSEASWRRKCSKMLAPKPPDVEKRSKMLAPKPLDVEKCSKMPAPKPLGVEKCFHGAERIIEKEIEKEFEKEFRSPALEDASLKEASLNDASLRAFNARVHTSITFLFFQVEFGGRPPGKKWCCFIDFVLLLFIFCWFFTTFPHLEIKTAK